MFNGISFPESKSKNCDSKKQWFSAAPLCKTKILKSEIDFYSYLFFILHKNNIYRNIYSSFHLPNIRSKGKSTKFFKNRKEKK